MNRSNTKPHKKHKPWRWFAGLYVSSLLVIGAAYAILHLILHVLMTTK